MTLRLRNRLNRIPMRLVATVGGALPLLPALEAIANVQDVWMRTTKNENKEQNI